MAYLWSDSNTKYFATRLHKSSKNDYICNRNADIMKEQSLYDWVQDKELRGYYTFSVEDVQKDFPHFSRAYISTSLYRLTARNKIVSPWKGFYVIIPIEYALKGIVPPVFYIDALMKVLNRRYYVSLLSAASFYGASHQRVQTFSVTTEGNKLRNTLSTGASLMFFSKKQISDKFIRQFKAQAGYVDVSSPELTAIDLIENEKYVGGLNRVCTVLNELVDSIDFDGLSKEFFQLAPMPVYQRFGYILDSVFERENLADKLAAKMESFSLRKVPFKIGKPISGCETENKWKVIVNQEIEIDE